MEFIVLIIKLTVSSDWMCTSAEFRMRGVTALLGSQLEFIKSGTSGEVERMRLWSIAFQNYINYIYAL